MPGVFLVFLLVCLLCVVLRKKKQVIIFLCKLKKIWEETRRSMET